MPNQINLQTATYYATRSSIDALIKTNPSLSKGSREVIEFVVSMLAATVEFLLKHPELAVGDKRKAASALVDYFSAKGIALGRLTGNQQVQCVTSIVELGLSYKEATMTVSIVLGPGTLNPYAWYCAVSFLATSIDLWDNCSPLVRQYLKSLDTQAKLRLLEQVRLQMYPLLRMEQRRQRGLMEA